MRVKREVEFYVCDHPYCNHGSPITEASKKENKQPMESLDLNGWLMVQQNRSVAAVDALDRLRFCSRACLAAFLGEELQVREYSRIGGGYQILSLEELLNV